MPEKLLRRSPNETLIGSPDSRRRLNTPCLILDLDCLDENIERMAALTKSAGVALRPHSKGHKSLAIAQKQLAAGAIGVCCTTLGEAEVMVDGGIENVLITSEVASPTMIARLIALNGKAKELAVVTDNPANVDALEEAAAQTSQPLSVIVEYDVGQGRTGVVDEDDAAALAQAVARKPHLRFAGIQAYYGHLQHIVKYSDRDRAVATQARRIRALRNRLSTSGLPPQIVTGGGTGTYAFDLASGVFTEIQPGSYPFLDREYVEIELAEGTPSFLPALFVGATVVSANRPGFVIVNAGYKSFATEGGPPVVSSPRLTEPKYQLMGDEHGGVSFRDAPDSKVGLADFVEFLVPHCDPTINLYDWYHCVRGDVLVEIWPVDARGR